MSDKNESVPDQKFESNVPKSKSGSPKDDLLDEVLRQTQQSNENQQFFQLLVNFCSIHSERQEMTEELMVDIVKMILQNRFPDQTLPEGCADWIGEVLFYDPASRHRVESVWKAALNQAS